MTNLKTALKKHKFTCDERTMVFRLKSGSDSYKRNLRNLSAGRTDFWRVDEKKLHPGQDQTIVLLIDHPDDKKVVLAYAGVFGREETPKNKVGKVLWVEKAFKEIAATPGKGIAGFLGKDFASGNSPTYPFSISERSAKPPSKSPGSAHSQRDLGKKKEGDTQYRSKAELKIMCHKHNQMTELLRHTIPGVKEGSAKNAMFDALIEDYDKKGNALLLEVKSSTDVSEVRMAVGQLYSYTYEGFKRAAPHLAVLLPNRPDESIVGFLKWQGIGLLWFDKETLCTSDRSLNLIAHCAL